MRKRKSCRIKGIFQSGRREDSCAEYVEIVDLRLYSLPVPDGNNVLPVEGSDLPCASTVDPQPASFSELEFHLQTLRPTISKKGIYRAGCTQRLGELSKSISSSSLHIGILVSKRKWICLYTGHA